MEAKSDRRRALLAALRCVATTGILVTAYYLLPLASAFDAATCVALVGGTVGPRVTR